MAQRPVPDSAGIAIRHTPPIPYGRPRRLQRYPVMPASGENAGGMTRHGPGRVIARQRPALSKIRSAVEHAVAKVKCWRMLSEEGGRYRCPIGDRVDR